MSNEFEGKIIEIIQSSDELRQRKKQFRLVLETVVGIRMWLFTFSDNPISRCGQLREGFAQCGIKRHLDASNVKDLVGCVFVWALIDIEYPDWRSGRILVKHGNLRPTKLLKIVEGSILLKPESFGQVTPHFEEAPFNFHGLPGSIPTPSQDRGDGSSNGGEG